MLNDLNLPPVLYILRAYCVEIFFLSNTAILIETPYLTGNSYRLFYQTWLKVKPNWNQWSRDRASATESRLGFDSSRVKPKIIKIGIYSFPAWRSTVGTVNPLQYVVGRWQLNSKPERSLCCLLAKVTWWIKCNCNYNNINSKSTLNPILLPKKQMTIPHERCADEQLNISQFRFTLA